MSDHRPRKLGLRLGPFTNRQLNRACRPGDLPGRDCNPFTNNNDRLRKNQGYGKIQDKHPLSELRMRECLPFEVPGIDCRGDFRGTIVPNRQQNRECQTGDIPGRDCNPFRNNNNQDNDLLRELRTRLARECLTGEVPGIDCRPDATVNDLLSSLLANRVPRSRRIAAFSVPAADAAVADAKGDEKAITNLNRRKRTGEEKTKS